MEIDVFEVQSKQCETCIYKETSPLDLKQLEQEITDAYMTGFFVGYRVCHHSESACCAGFWARHKNHFAVGQVAQRLGLVVYVNHDTLKVSPGA